MTSQGSWNRVGSPSEIKTVNLFRPSSVNVGVQISLYVLIRAFFVHVAPSHKQKN
jgi:hypothetical protein